MLIIFSIEHHLINSPYRFASSIKRLSVHPKSSNHSGNLDHYRCGELIIRLLVAFGLWVFVLRRSFGATLGVSLFLYVMLYFVIRSLRPRGSKSVVRTKSSDKGQIMLPNGRSPLYVTKSSDEGHHGARAWPSPLYVTKSSEQGQCPLGEVRCT
jgi:hypothetical protein